MANITECIEAKEALDFLNALHIIVNLARKFKTFYVSGRWNRGFNGVSSQIL